MTAELAGQLDMAPAEVAGYLKAGMPHEYHGAVGWLLVNGKVAPRRIVDREYLARYFSVTTTTISNWTAAGMPALPDGAYDLDECVAWRMTQLANRHDSKLADIKRQRAELDLMERRQLVAPVQPILDRVARRLNELKAILGQLPERLAALAVESGVASDADISAFLRAAQEMVDHGFDATADMIDTNDSDEEELNA